MESLLEMYWFTFVIYLSYCAELLYCLATGWIYESVIIRSEEKIELEANWLECMFYPSRNQSTAEFYYWRPLHNCILLTQCLHLETITDEGKKRQKISIIYRADDTAYQKEKRPEVGFPPYKKILIIKICWMVWGETLFWLYNLITQYFFEKWVHLICVCRILFSDPNMVGITLSTLIANISTNL